MPIIYAKSETAKKALALVKDLQSKLVSELETLDANAPLHLHEKFAPVEWARNEGKFGGGVRLVAQNPRFFNRASVNISQVQYEDDPSKKLASATAISTIVHPAHPLAPSMHMHISWTEMKSNEGPIGYWRIMADLNPSHPIEEDTREFEAAFVEAVPEAALRLVGTKQGDRYFHIPALQRNRGVAHFYLEEYRGEDAMRDLKFAKVFGETIIAVYARIVRRALMRKVSASETERATQLAYHTLYFLQVLTLDRGTTSGLLVHNENDIGILGSLPSHVDRRLLEKWVKEASLPKLQAQLVEILVRQMPETPIVEVTDDLKSRLAEAARGFYRAHPAALELLARGDVVPPTQENHR